MQIILLREAYKCFIPLDFHDNDVINIFIDQKVEIDKTRILEESIQGSPGKVQRIAEDGVVVGAMNRGLLIEQITIDGEKRNPVDYFRIGDELK